MKRLLYISTAREILPSLELDRLLAKSRTANAAADVTGLLIVGGRRFLQVLEGPEQAVNATFDRISRDPHHFALVKLHDHEVTTKSFASWAMGYERGGAASASLPLDKQIQAILAPIADANLRAYFNGFAKTHARSGSA